MARTTYELSCEIQDEHGFWHRSVSHFDVQDSAEVEPATEQAIARLLVGVNPQPVRRPAVRELLPGRESRAISTGARHSHG